jgi:hypothetical protein
LPATLLFQEADIIIIIIIIIIRDHFALKALTLK